MRIVPGGSKQSGTFDARCNGFPIWKDIAGNNSIEWWQSCSQPKQLCGYVCH
jgi:hypothetical protein